VCSPTGCRQRPDDAAAQNKHFTYVGRGGGGDDGVDEDSTTTTTKFSIYTDRRQTAAKPKALLFVVKRLYCRFESLY
jgi:hypothetical protein